MKELAAERYKLEKVWAMINDEINAITHQLTEEKDPEKIKLLNEKRAELRNQYAAINVKKNVVNTQIEAVVEKIVDAEIAANGGNNQLIPAQKGAEYYDSVGVFGKAKLKSQAYEAATGTKPGFFRKALLMLPSNNYSQKAAEMLESGTVQPLEQDAENLMKEAEKQAAEKRAEAIAQGKKDAVKVLTPEVKAEAEEAAKKEVQDVIAKAEETAKQTLERAAKKEPEKEGEPR